MSRSHKTTAPTVLSLTTFPKLREKVCLTHSALFSLIHPPPMFSPLSSAVLALPPSSLWLPVPWPWPWLAPLTVSKLGKYNISVIHLHYSTWIYHENSSLLNCIIHNTSIWTFSLKKNVYTGFHLLGLLILWPNTDTDTVVLSVAFFSFVYSVSFLLIMNQFERAWLNHFARNSCTLQSPKHHKYKHICICDHYDAFYMHKLGNKASLKENT